MSEEADNPQHQRQLKIPYKIVAVAGCFSVLDIIATVWLIVHASHTGFLIDTRISNLFYVGIVAVFIISIFCWLSVVFRVKKFNQTIANTDHERKHAEKALQLSERKFRELIQNANDLVYTSDLEGNFTSLNRVGEEITGYTQEEALSLNVSDVIVPEHLEYARRMTIRKIEGERATRYEVDIIAKDRSRITLELSSRIIFDDGVPTGIQGIARDITVRRKNEESLRKSEAKYRSLVDSLPAVVYVLEAEPPYKPIYVSPNLTAATGYTWEQWISNPDFWNGILHPLDAERVKEQTTAALEKIGEKEIEYRILKADGSELWIDDRGRFVKDLDGKRLYWQGVILNITERRRNEERLLKSEERYRVLSEGIAHHVWTALPGGRLDYINERVVNYFGVPEKKLLAEGWESMVHPEDLPAAMERWEQSIKTGEYFEAKSRLRKADGEYLWHMTRAIPGFDSDGQITKWFGTNTDIEAQIRADRALRESEHKLRSLLKSMSEGLMKVSNDYVIEFVNERFCEMTGYEEDELLGRITFDLLFDDETVEFIKRRNERRLQGVYEHYELSLKKKSGEKLWVLVGGAPTHDGEGNIIGSMGVFTDITKRKLAEDRLVHDAFHDSLTGLANRALFTDHLRLRIERAKREQETHFAVLFIDFDRFKVINDSLGHAQGDKLLVAVGQRLSSTMRTSDLIARLGGDEFTILLNELEDASHAVSIAERIQELLQKPFALETGEVFMSASIGIALGLEGRVTAEDMLRNADIAMYRAKSKGKARHQLFDQAMHEEALSQLKVETDLRQALSRNEFLLHFQPIFNLHTKTIVGFESLVRWRHSTRGLIPPEEFIPIVEENGLILPLGRWIIYESCRQMYEWQKLNPAARNLAINVNLSCKQFLQLDLAEQVMALLVATKLDPASLKLEITESHVMENGEAAVKMMDRLRAIGVEISLDDFGTGYSSLSYLHRLPVTNLKIDRSFVNQITGSGESSKLVNTIITLAHTLKMNVTAEGIENAEQLIQLKEFNCENGQGYYFSKPLEADAISELIKNLPATASSELSAAQENLDLIG